MKADNAIAMLEIGGVCIALYLAYRFISKASTVVSDTANAIANEVSAKYDAYSDWVGELENSWSNGSGTITSTDDPRFSDPKTAGKVDVSLW